MENLLYYPGCTVKRNAREYEETSIAVLEKLGISVIELREWYCCGALYSLAVDDLIKHLGAVRTLVNAEKLSSEYNTNKLLTICPMCFNVLKRVNKLLKSDPDKLSTITQYMDEEEPYHVSIDVIHIVEILSEKKDELKKLVVRGLGDIGVAVYYGCTILRPKDIGVDDPEEPRIIDDLLRELGVNVVDFPFKSLCCGAYHVLDKKDIVYSNSTKILEAARDNGAKLVVTICPLCLYNLRISLNKLSGKEKIYIVYLTELLAYMFGLDQVLSKNTLEIFNTIFTYKDNK